MTAARKGSVAPGWIVEGMKQRGWTQADVSRMTGLTPNTVSDVLRGRPARATTLRAIRTVFEADLTGTGLAQGSTAAKGAVEKMIHEDPLFGQIYLSYTMMSGKLRQKSANYMKRLALKGNTGDGGSPEGDT